MAKALFIIPDLSGHDVSYPEYHAGHVAFSCSRGSWLRVVEGLSTRGHEIGVHVLSGERLSGTRAHSYLNLYEAAEWSRKSAVVACSWGNEELVPLLNEYGIRPRLWLKTHLDDCALQSLENGQIESIVVPSDFARLYALHSREHRRIGRVYNPIAPVFEGRITADDERYASKRVVFAGNIGTNKGAHRVLELWPKVKRKLPEARLTMAGSPRLYDSSTNLGAYGVATDDFERDYLEPLVREFGTLELAGVDFPGALSPLELLKTYKVCALGVANLNWSTSVETFGCATVEMLASGLPIVGFARGALIETAGASAAAVLQKEPCLDSLAEKIVSLLKQPELICRLAVSGEHNAKARFGAEAVLDAWELMLNAPPTNAFSVSGEWSCPGRFRYCLEVAAGRLGMGKPYTHMLAALRALKSKVERFI